jgi:hypothetical protein
MFNKNPNIISLQYKKSWYYLLFLLVVLWVAYWPISLYIFSLKNDALNYFLPVRRLVSESYHNGFLPLWTPYLNLGYPLHGDMQSGVWNPFVQLFSLFGPYNLYTLQLETLLYIYLSGAGMFYLLKYFRIHPYSNILASAAFMLCGFNSDSAQFLNWITAASCLPFLFLFYYRLLEERKIKWALATAILLFICFTSAYPADFILATYLLASVFIWYYFKRLSSIKEIIIPHLILIGIFILLSLPAILSYMQSLPLTERGTGASYEDVMTNSLHPALLSAYTTPLGVWKMPGIHNTDPLERNSFIGLVTFILLIISFLIKSTAPVNRFAKWAFIIFLLFSFGEIGGLRILAYYALPLMNTFRHPANAKLFTSFFACILAACSFTGIINREVNTQKIKSGLLITLSLLLGILVFSFFTPYHLFLNNKYEEGITLIQRVKNGIDNMSFADLVLANTIIQLPFLFFTWKYLVKKNNFGSLVVAGILNSMLFTMLFQPFTVVKTQKASAIQQIVNANSVNGYPIPDITSSLNVISNDNEKNIADIGCLALYNKKNGRSDYRITPSNLLTQNDFWFNEPFRELVMKYPLIYRADYIADTGSYPNAIHDTLNKWAFLNNFKDSIAEDKDSNAKISVSRFYPANIEGEITSTKNGFFILLQNYYPRWKLYIDGKKQNIRLADISFMGFDIPKGVHKFSFRYEDTDIRIAFAISLATLLLIIIVLVIKTKKPIQEYSSPSSQY